MSARRIPQVDVPYALAGGFAASYAHTLCWRRMDVERGEGNKLYPCPAFVCSLERIDSTTFYCTTRKHHLAGGEDSNQLAMTNVSHNCRNKLHLHQKQVKIREYVVTKTERKQQKYRNSIRISIRRKRDMVRKLICSRARRPGTHTRHY